MIQLNSSFVPWKFILLIVWIFLSIQKETTIMSSGADILMIHPIYSRSHELIFISLGEELTRRGHNVTLVRFSGQSIVTSKLLRIVNLMIRAPEGKHIPHLKPNGETDVPYHLLWHLPPTMAIGLARETITINEYACDTLMSNETQNLIFEGYNYKVAIVDLVLNECGLALAHYKNLPVVAYWAFVHNSAEQFFTSSTLAPAIVPALMSELPDKMNFVERVTNTFHYVLQRLLTTYIIMNPMHSIITKHLPNSPHPTELLHNMSMIFINSDFTLDFPRPLSPNIIHIGCIQCRPPKPLPKELEYFMQSSGEHGVIVFSLGATFSEGGLPQSVVETIYEAFGRLKQKIIMKMSENAPSVKLPPNVKTVPWFPQQDILGHPKTKLLITHCGMHGALEAIYHGVPMVGMPIFFDQVDVLVRMKHKGIAFGLNKNQLTSDNIEAAVHTVLSNDSYRTNVKMLSIIIKDIIQSPMDKAIHWTEYVIRHNGAEHLKMSDRHLNLAQYILLDVIALIVAMLFLVIFLTKWFMCYIIGKCFMPSKQTRSKIKTKKH